MTNDALTYSNFGGRHLHDCIHGEAETVRHLYYACRELIVATPLRRITLLLQEQCGRLSSEDYLNVVTLPAPGF
jgi:hypothetical protein